MGVVIGCILWYSFGYSLTFGPSCNSDGCSGDNNGFIGDINTHAFFKDVDAFKCTDGSTIPHLLFATFQMTFVRATFCQAKSIQFPQPNEASPTPPVF
jgi:ammonia channel protein AmtB